MSENKKNINEPQKLSDDELDLVAGGYWSGDREDGARGFFEVEKRFGRTSATTFEEFLEERYSQTLRDRQAWVDAGSPAGSTEYNA